MGQSMQNRGRHSTTRRAQPHTARQRHPEATVVDPAEVARALRTRRRAPRQDPASGTQRNEARGQNRSQTAQA